MAPRGLCPLLLLTLVLRAGLAQLTPTPDSSQRFVKEHVDFPRTNTPNAQRYCDLLMVRRNLTSPFCKPRHTFIHAPVAQLQAVCGHAGICDRCHHCSSREALPLTTCQVLVGAHPGRCSYRGRTHTNRIRVTCGPGGPVRLDQML